MSQHTLLSFLRENNVQSAVGYQREVVIVPPGEKVGQILRKMSQKNILSVMVCDEGGKFLGLIDMIDLVTYLAKTHFGFAHQEVIQESMDDLLVEGNLFFGEKASTILNSKDRPSFQVKLDTPLASVVEEFSKGYYHSAAVRDDNGKIINAISQSDIANFLLKNQLLLKGLMELQISQLCIKHVMGNKQVMDIHENDCVMDALKLISEKRISGLAVVDKNNKLVGNFSASDIRALSDPWEFRLLSDKVKGFMEFTQQKHPSGPVTCALSDTIQQVLQIMEKEKVHRVYLVDQSELTGVVTLTDIMDNFVKRVSAPLVCAHPIIQEAH